ncbi:MAG: hypothetical protein SV375_00315 [Thermodesulfobacteriota bacterium]|nr:hypothetical protein [Thermodesulfobacteriota bacterium]
MKNNIKKMWMWIAILALVHTGCYYQKKHVPEEKAVIPKVKKMVVFGFRPVMSKGEDPDVIRGSLSGSVFMAGPVPKNVVDKMTSNLFNKLLEDQSHDLISPAQANGVFSSLVSSDLTLRDIEIYQKIGKIFDADAVLTGYIYRWKEREGTDFAVNRPASVAFDLYLIRPRNGAILWKGRFDKTQRSLSENLFDMNTFIKGGGKWMTAEKLAELGLENLLGRFLEREGGQ